ncbi:MAG: hypothetical protein V7676_06090 [Parasphingorhabdus sp.]|uniref:hypothetical protein n=1 Tax=Parasphingorhabdus sp. TaxID=2709688 RepID=UPI0030022BC0
MTKLENPGVKALGFFVADSLNRWCYLYSRKAGVLDMSFVNMFLSATEQFPEIMLEQLLRRKMKESGVQAWRAGAKAMASHLVHKKDEEFHWEDYPNTKKDITVIFTEEDGKELENIFDNLEGTLEEVCKEMLKSTSRLMTEKYKEDWHRHQRSQERFVANFKNNLEDRWSEGLDGLRLLLDLCRDEGTKFHDRIEKSKPASFPHRRIALSKMHIRACQVTSEIICLLESGFANGALLK